MMTLDKIVLNCHQIPKKLSMICLTLSRILYTRLDGRSGVASTLTGTPGGRPPPTPTGTTGRGIPSGAVRVPALCLIKFIKFLFLEWPNFSFIFVINILIFGESDRHLSYLQEAMAMKLLVI